MLLFSSPTNVFYRSFHRRKCCDTVAGEGAGANKAWLCKKRCGRDSGSKNKKSAKGSAAESESGPAGPASVLGNSVVTLGNAICYSGLRFKIVRL